MWSVCGHFFIIARIGSYCDCIDAIATRALFTRVPILYGDVVAMVDRSLPEDIQDRLKQKVTEVIVKPVPWSELKNKIYFS